MEKESEFLNKLMIFFMYRGENYIIKTKFIYREFMVTIQFWITFLDRKHLIFIEL